MPTEPSLSLSLAPCAQLDQIPLRILLITAGKGAESGAAAIIRLIKALITTLADSLLILC